MAPDLDLRFVGRKRPARGPKGTWLLGKSGFLCTALFL
jgi:hypothetical protein